MTAIGIRPGPVHGTITAPPSKSYTHRALIAGYLARRATIVDRPLVADDTRRTAAALRALGATVRLGARRWTVAPPRAGRLRRRVRVDCGESGTTLRFVAALAARTDQRVALDGRGRLPQRPMGALVRALRSLGATVDAPGSGRWLPMVVRGPLRPGRVSVDASESSQFVSALLLTLPVLDGPSTLRLPSPPVSKPYIDATLAVARAQGVRIASRVGEYRTAGRQAYRGGRFRVPGDASSAAYLWAAAAVGGGSVTVAGVPAGWPQADLAILPLLERFGATVDRRARTTTVRSGTRRPFRIDLTDAPDLYPLAGVLAACAPGESRLEGAAHVVAKESDRRAETARLARAMGATVARAGEGLVIGGSPSPRPFSWTTADDHRVVMSAAVGALATSGPCRVGRAEAVRKSYPGFWRALRSLTGPGRVT